MMNEWIMDKEIYAEWMNEDKWIMFGWIDELMIVTNWYYIHMIPRQMISGLMMSGLMMSGLMMSRLMMSGFLSDEVNEWIN